MRLIPLVCGVNIAAQVALVLLGVVVGVAPSAEETLALLLWWCSLALAYVIAVAIAVTIVSRSRRPPSASSTSRLLVGRVSGFVATSCTVLASLCGIAGAAQVRFNYSFGPDEVAATIAGIAAMLLSWVLLHWGYAQAYLRRHRRSPEPALSLPGTEHPRLSDFVYVAFTVGTTFAASDAKILSPRVRWTVVQHSVLSFFYNGAIIVLALNTLTASG
ncbi:DUF1345 domain-containing protein [Leifsonia poae]|uniref:DUF1345 domain-containing protein n=1 Tax=Leifsonia poae TaxID=110933 RepID=UPI003D69FAFC